MNVKSTKSGNAVVISVEGRMDAASTPEFERACAEWIQQGEKKLVIDLAGLQFISSAGLRGVLTAGKKLKDGGGGLSLCGLSGVVKQVFEISGFATLFPVFDSREAALKAT
ncbi:MAG: STAS domain-containing protein [Candidatus Riflebacteria bacterium]|nr:STAS domain-containing protein [Candidatus Riflebacteria bacterium]